MGEEFRYVYPLYVMRGFIKHNRHRIVLRTHGKIRLGYSSCRVFSVSGT